MLCSSWICNLKYFLKTVLFKAMKYSFIHSSNLKRWLMYFPSVCNISIYAKTTETKKR